MQSPADVDHWLSEMIAVLDSRFTVYVEPMTLPAATAELLAWLDDHRQFISAQYDDWQSMLDDFRDAFTAAGPKLRRAVEHWYQTVESQFVTLFTISIDANGTTSPSIDEQTRVTTRSAAAALQAHLGSDQPVKAAWVDLQQACMSLTQSVEDIEFKRKCLWALAQTRRQDTSSRFGLRRQLVEVMRGIKTTRPPEQQHPQPAESAISTPDVVSPHQADALAWWQRAQLCEQILLRSPRKADCIVWLRFASAYSYQDEVTHGQVTLYIAQRLGASVGHPEWAHNFTVVPHEVLDLPPATEENDRLGWASEPGMVYARVFLPDIEIHLAPVQASTLVSALVQVSEPHPETWSLLEGHLLFADDHLLTSWGWWPSDLPDLPPQFPFNDAVSRRIELMDSTSRSLDTATVEQLAAALALSNALKRARDEGAEATVMAAVRAIEHVNAWAVGGRSAWANFACTYFKKATARAQLVAFLGDFAQTATTEVPDPSPDADTPPPDLGDIHEDLWTSSAGVDYFNVKKAIAHLTRLREIYQQHWLHRGLAEMESVFASGRAVAARLDTYGRRFDAHLRRLKRIRNATVHGGPVTPDSCESVATFAYHLGHFCLNQVITAYLTGTDIAVHLDNFREQEMERRHKIEADSAYDELFVASPI
ncbi:hypothetical protein ACQPW1_22680 [Nocardia sp. CA-128927]|uniref:hypothetical protein n=1 Tax=Nocardia sp. CA-128927 TaxID=3239975 RepID=UPI003D957B12